MPDRNAGFALRRAFALALLAAAAGCAREDEGRYQARISGAFQHQMRGPAAFCTGPDELLLILGEPELNRFIGFFRHRSNDLPAAGEHAVLSDAVNTADPLAIEGVLPRLDVGGQEMRADLREGTVRFTDVGERRIAGTFRLRVQDRRDRPEDFVEIEEGVLDSLPAPQADLTGTFLARFAGPCEDLVRW